MPYKPVTSNSQKLIPLSKWPGAAADAIANVNERFYPAEYNGELGVAFSDYQPMYFTFNAELFQNLWKVGSLSFDVAQS